MPRVRTFRKEFTFTADGQGVTGTFEPEDGLREIHGEIRQVRIIYPTAAVHTLSTVLLKLYQINADHQGGDQGALLYDTGTLTHGVDGVVLTENDTPIWNDHLGAQGPLFRIGTNKSLGWEISVGVSAGSGTSSVFAEIDYIEMDA